MHQTLLNVCKINSRFYESDKKDSWLRENLGFQYPGEMYVPTKEELEKFSQLNTNRQLITTTFEH